MKQKNQEKKQARVFPSFLKGLKILDAMIEVEHGCKLVDIANEVNMPASAVLPYINTLIESGWCTKNDTNKKYFLSQDKKNDFMNSINHNYSHILNAAEPVMNRIHEKYNENVLLAIRRLGRVVFISRIESSRPIKIEIDQLPDYPTHATAAGRAILAFDTPENIEEYFYNAKYEVYTKNTLANRKRLLDELAKTRERGYAFNYCEFEDFISALAAPIHLDGKAVASLIIQLPSFRYKKDECLKIADDIVFSANQISASLKRKIK